MLVSRRIINEPALGALVAASTILHTRYRIFVGTIQGMVSDASLFSRAPSWSWNEKERCLLMISLQGESRAGGHDSNICVREGELHTTLRSRGWFVRNGPAAWMMIEWEPSFFGTPLLPLSDPRPLSSQGLTRLRRLANTMLRLEPGTSAESARACAEIVRVLRAEGIPFEPLGVEELREEVPPWARSLSVALDETLSSMRQGPAALDLEENLGWTRQYIQRRMNEFNQRYAFHVSGGWRDLLLRWRLIHGAALMTAPRATTENVAEALGYASASAFCHAFANAGLPTPSEVRSRLIRG